MSLSTTTVVPYAVVAGDTAARAAIDAVFFDSSSVTTFADDAVRSAFRERWLGRYLERHADCCFIALDATGDIQGYICGSLRDPARDPGFADQPHFKQFAAVTPNYPAQLHVNLAASARGQGVGRRLIEALAVRASASGAPGLHAITTRGARNVSFYAANNFTEVASATIGDKELVFLGRKLR